METAVLSITNKKRAALKKKEAEKKEEKMEVDEEKKDEKEKKEKDEKWVKRGRGGGINGMITGRNPKQPLTLSRILPELWDCRWRLLLSLRIRGEGEGREGWREELSIADTNRWSRSSWEESSLSRIEDPRRRRNSLPWYGSGRRDTVDEYWFLLSTGVCWRSDQHGCIGPWASAPCHLRVLSR